MAPSDARGPAAAISAVRPEGFQSGFGADVILALDRIVAGKTMDDEAVRGAGIELYGEATIGARMTGAGTE